MLFIGLGNPGPEYAATRHNIGFMVMDALAEMHNESFKPGRYADVAELRYKGRQLTLIKPTTFMNLSGKAVRYWLNEKKLEINQSITVVDDLALPFGRLRLRIKGSDAGHNGLKDIQKVLNTATYPRLRMGIGDDFAKGQQVDYVLGKFNAEEESELPAFVEAACQCLLDAATQGLERSMGTHNKK